MSRLRVRESVITADQVVAVQWLTSEGLDCGTVHYPIEEWAALADKAAAGTWPLIDRECGDCGHEGHSAEYCNAAVYAEGATSTSEYCNCGSSDFAHAPVIQFPGSVTDLVDHGSVPFGSRTVSL